MNSIFGAPTLLFGLLALAAGLYLLQRLRVRHQPVRVISTLFWRAAVEEARARVLVERFRHPLVYLFLLAICGLLWLAAGGLDLSDRTGPRHVVVIDGSAAMAAESSTTGEPARFETLLDRVAERVAELPRARRQVLFAGGELRTLLSPGEPDRLFAVRANGLRPERAPSSVESTILSLLPQFAGGARATLWIASDTPLSATLRGQLPPTVTIGSIEAEGVVARGDRIIACGVSPAANGDWEEVDVLVEVASPNAPGAVSLSARIDDTFLTEGVVRREVLGGVQFWFEGLPASGGRFEAMVGDNTVARILPTRRILRVLLDPTLAPWLTPVLSADPALRVVESGETSPCVGREVASDRTFPHSSS